MKRLVWYACLTVCAAVLLIGSPASQAKELSGELEIYSWWVGEEATPLNSLIQLYSSRYPGVKIINAGDNGASGTDSKTILRTRMQGKQPPDLLQTHVGQELIGSWVKAGRMEDLTPLFKTQGWQKTFPKELMKSLGTTKGIWSVPLNIHRANVMWYVPANLQQWGVSVPKSWDEFLDIAPVLKKKGIVPLALADNWTANHLWESVALAGMGPENWEALWAGKLAFDSPIVVKAWLKFGRIIEFTNQDASSLTWQQATDRVTEGKAAFTVMGDWAAKYLQTDRKLAANTDFAWAAAPGTAGQFLYLADSFGLPKGVKNREAAMAWLKLLGSREGSELFNTAKGSLAARGDVDSKKYDPYTRTAAADFAKDKVVGSMVHGVAANEGFMTDFAMIMTTYLKDRNAIAAAKQTQQIAIKNGIAH